MGCLVNHGDIVRSRSLSQVERITMGGVLGHGRAVHSHGLQLLRTEDARWRTLRARGCLPAQLRTRQPARVVALEQVARPRIARLSGDRKRGCPLVEHEIFLSGARTWQVLCTPTEALSGPNG